MKKIFIAPLSFLLHASLLHAGSIQVAQWIPWNFVKQEFFRQTLDTKVEQSIMALSLGELTPVSRGFSFSLQGNLSALEIDQVGMRAEGHHLQAEIKMDEISIDQFILREFGGNRIRIQLKAKCSGINIVIPEFSAFMNSHFVPEPGSWSPQVNDLQLQIPSQGWSVSPITCTGISGVEDEISAMIKSSLNDPSIIEDFIQQWLSQKVSELWQSSWNSLIMSTGTDLRILEMQKPQSQGITILAELPIASDKNILLSGLERSQFGQDVPQLILSQDGFHALMEDKFLSLSPVRYNLQKVDGFSSLMKSRFKQSLAWPDLRRFPSRTPFYLTSYPNESRLLLKAKSSGIWQAQLNANGVLQTEIQTASIDYLYWGMSVSAEMSASVRDGVIKISTGKSTLGLAWSFAPIYQLIFNPNNRISTDVLKSSINGLFSNQVIEQELPDLKIDGRVWELQNFKGQDEFISMDWVEKTI